jgi:hypothetical protein
LRLGHRQSIDLDLFREEDFDPELLLRELAQGGRAFENVRTEPGTLSFEISGVPVSLMRFQYPRLGAADRSSNARCVRFGRTHFSERSSHSTQRRSKTHLRPAGESSPLGAAMDTSYDAPPTPAGQSRNLESNRLSPTSIDTRTPLPSSLSSPDCLSAHPLPCRRSVHTTRSVEVQ